MIPGAPTLQELLNLASRLAVEGIRVSIPARVERVNLAEGWVDVKVLVKDHVELDGDLVTEDLKILQRVPIHIDGGGGFRKTYPVAVEDTGKLVFCERSIDEWKAYGGEVEPADLRRHSLNDAFFEPGPRPFSSPWTGVLDSATTWGKDGGLQIHITINQIQLGGADATHDVATAQKVETQLNALKSALTSFLTSNPLAAASFLDGGVAFQTAMGLILASFPGSTASSAVKVKP